MSYQKILVGLERSFQASLVFERALQQAQTNNGGLIVVHTVRLEAVQPLDVYWEMGNKPGGNTYDNFQHWQERRLEQEINRAQQWLAPFHEWAQEQNIPTEIDCKTGDAGVWICALAENRGVDLIVIGRRTCQGIKAVALGSVSNYVVQHAPCSVLVVQ